MYKRQVLESLDVGTQLLQTLCPATEVSLAAGTAAFLRPESDPGTTTANCPDDGPLNGDGDTEDTVVAFWAGAGPVLNLARAADTIVVNDAWIGALAGC